MGIFVEKAFFYTSLPIIYELELVDYQCVFAQ